MLQQQRAALQQAADEASAAHNEAQHSLRSALQTAYTAGCDLSEQDLACPATLEARLKELAALQVRLLCCPLQDFIVNMLQLRYVPSSLSPA